VIAFALSVLNRYGPSLHPAWRSTAGLFLLFAGILIVADLNGWSRYGEDVFLLLLGHTLKWLMYATAGMLSVSLRPNRRVSYVVGFIAASVVYAGVMSTMYYLDPASRLDALGGLSNPQIDKVQGVRVDTGKNAYALHLALILALVLEVTPPRFRSAPWLPMLRFLTAAGLVLAINIAASRTGLVAVFLILILFARSAKRRFWLCVATGLAIFLLVVYPVLYSSFASLHRTTSSITAGNELYGLDLGNRTNLARDSLSDIWATPIVGRGFFAKFYANDVLVPSGAHNLYIQLVIESGFVGLILWIALTWNLIRLALAVRHTWLGYAPLSIVFTLAVTAVSEVYLEGPGMICTLSVLACLSIAERTTRVRRRYWRHLLA